MNNNNAPSGWRATRRLAIITLVASAIPFFGWAWALLFYFITLIVAVVMLCRGRDHSVMMFLTTLIALPFGMLAVGLFSTMLITSLSSVKNPTPPSYATSSRFESSTAAGRAEQAKVQAESDRLLAASPTPTPQPEPTVRRALPVEKGTNRRQATEQKPRRERNE